LITGYFWKFALLFRWEVPHKRRESTVHGREAFTFPFSSNYLQNAGKQFRHPPPWAAGNLDRKETEFPGAIEFLDVTLQAANELLAPGEEADLHYEKEKNKNEKEEVQL
jgi:hypothetical protein